MKDGYDQSTSALAGEGRWARQENGPFAVNPFSCLAQPLLAPAAFGRLAGPSVRPGALVAFGDHHVPTFKALKGLKELEERGS